MSCGFDGKIVVQHRRSCVLADIVIDPVHARALRLARKATQRLGTGDVDVPVTELSVYDALAARADVA